MKMKISRRFLLVIIAVSVALPALAWAQDSSPIDVGKYTQPIKLACVGDSITAGVGAGKGQSWPDQVRGMLGEKWDVKNFGDSGKTLMNSGDRPYQKTATFKKAKEFNPDVVVIILGTNDTKPQNWKNFKKDFEADYKDMVKQFAETANKPRIFVCYPPYVGKKGNYGINEPNVLEEIPVVAKVAKDMNLGVIDVHGATDGKDALFPDKVHPNAEGARAIAAAVFKALTGKEAPAEAEAGKAGK
jgi:lysophospholipase L1-like esterase